MNIKPHVLIVEDDSDISDMLFTYLVREGYGVRVVTNHADALEALRFPHRFILLDYNLPQSDPLSFVLTVQLNFPDSIIVLMTASTSIKTHAAELGLKHWIGKPFDPDVLLELLQRLDAGH